MKKIRKQKGITLIALIITIVVLLILAVVTINSVKDGGIITQAQKAASDYNKGKSDEETTIAGYEALIESKLPGVKDSSVIGKATVGKIADKNSTINGETYSSTNPIIPAGFAPINITTTGQESSWNAEGGPQVNNGLVITDNTTKHASEKATVGSEFVWVPVSEINKMIMCQEHGATLELDKETLQCPECRENTMLAGKLYTDVKTSTGIFNISETGQTYKEAVFREPDIIEKYDKDHSEYIAKEQLQNEFDNMAKSVAKYGGFYVGRYETSLTVGKTAQSKYGETSSNPYKEDTKRWYGLYIKSKTYESIENSVQSSMIWGSQYDAMMLWMGENYANNDIGNLRNKKTVCGTDADDIIKNIYDLYGNGREWTLEKINTNNRVYRGGNINYSNSPSYRSSNTPTSTSSDHGSRLILYIL